MLDLGNPTAETDSVAGDAVRGEPVCGSKFPANREINREFFKFGLFSAIFASNRPANSTACVEIPYTA
jgi:hypothetical protein